MLKCSVPGVFHGRGEATTWAATVTSCTDARVENMAPRKAAEEESFRWRRRSQSAARYGRQIGDPPSHAPSISKVSSVVYNDKALHLRIEHWAGSVFVFFFLLVSVGLIAD